MIMNLAWMWTAFAAIIVAISISKLFLRSNKSKKLPPGPKALPILGHLHLIGKNVHQDLHKLSKIHGPIMHLRFGLVDNIVASTPEAAKQFLKTHDLNFANRPPSQAAKYISNGQKGLSFGRYGPYWRHIRKMCTLEFLSNLKINSFQPMRNEEVRLLVDSFKEAAEARQTVDLSASVSSLSANMSCRMVFGKKYEDKDISEKGFKSIVFEAVHLTALPNLGDFFPFLGEIGIQGLTRRLKAVGKLFDEFLEKIIDEHEHAEKTRGERTQDFVDTMLEIMKTGETSFQITREHVKSVMLDLLIASMDTSSSVIEWTMSELLRHPEAMEKVKAELEREVGLDRMVEEKDLERLKYLELVIKESLRLHPVVPLLLPHAAIEECDVSGYIIPKNATVTVNVWAIGRDPNAWSDPEEFIPERFISKSDVEYRGQNFELLPFGSGRRSCPGIQLGITVVRFVVAQLLHCFDWELPDGILPKQLDMIENFGLVLSRANHLKAIPKYRLNV